MLRWIGIGLMAAALAGGCKKEKADSGDGAAERDGKALWKLAPEGTSAGVVVAAGAGAELHRGFIAVATSLESHPIGAEAVAKMLAEARAEGVDPLSPDGFKSLGVDTTKAGALFFVGDDAYAVLPIGDRQAFRARIEATEKNGMDVAEGESACEQDGDYYRCAKSVEKLEAWKPASKPIDAGWPEELRGSVEFYVGGELLAGEEPIEKSMTQASALRGAVRIERGAALLRFSIAGAVKPMLATGETPLADAVKATSPAALLTADGRTLLELMRAEMTDVINKPGPGGVTPGKVFDALTGELVAFAPAGGAARGFVEIGISDPAPFKALATLCTMAPPLGPGVEIKATQDGCAAKIGAPIAPMPIEIAVAITDKALVAKLGDTSDGRGGKGPALPGFYRSNRWLGSLWLRGSVLGAADALAVPQMAEALEQTPQLGLGLWGYAHLSELGMGLRTDDKGAHGFLRVATTWRNPQEVVDKLEPLIGRFARGDLSVTGEVKKLASANSGSPLAKDLELGATGGAAGAAGLGMIAAVAIPAFVKYQRRAREAGLEVYAAQLQSIKQMMCACRDKTCAEQVAKQLEDWRRGLGSMEPQLRDREDVRDATLELTECMAKAMGSP